MYIAIYLAAIVAANMLVVQFGPSVTVLNAFVFIGLDLTCRDRLHEQWQHRNLGARMATLIIAGSVLSWLLNRNAGPIALASCVAFGAAATVDALVYHGLRRHAWATKVNGSNVLGAAVDSVIFPTLAFGALLPLVVLGQFTAKVAGGLLWSVVLRRRAAEVTV